MHNILEISWGWEMDRSHLRRLLEKFSLIILDDSKVIFCSKDNTIRPIVEAVIALGERLNNTIIADRVVGRAAALVIANTRPRFVYAIIMSGGGLEVLKKYGIRHSYERLVERILTPSGETCPFERLVSSISDPEEALRIISSRLEIYGKTLNKKKMKEESI